MNYEMEELVPIVGRLAEKYTAFESTSITYEKAEQLMAAVLYCIHEAELMENHGLISAEGISAQQAYETGLDYVEKKTRRAMKLYNEILPEFAHYGNDCLYDTFVKGLPEFFRWYDTKFEPQNTILTLDYPVLKNLTEHTGIDRIYEFINCICMEQRFLAKFPEGFVVNILSKYHDSYQTMIENLCEIVLAEVLRHILAKKPLSEQKWTEADELCIQRIFWEKDLKDIRFQSANQLEIFLRKNFRDDGSLFDYFSGCMEDILYRLKTAAENERFL